MKNSPLFPIFAIATIVFVAIYLTCNFAIAVATILKFIFSEYFLGEIKIFLDANVDQLLEVWQTLQYTYHNVRFYFSSLFIEEEIIDLDYFGEK